MSSNDPGINGKIQNGQDINIDLDCSDGGDPAL